MNWDSVGAAIISMELAANLLDGLRGPIRRLEEQGGGASDLFHADCWDEVREAAPNVVLALRKDADALRRCASEDNPA